MVDVGAVPMLRLRTRLKPENEPQATRFGEPRSWRGAEEPQHGGVAEESGASLDSIGGAQASFDPSFELERRQEAKLFSKTLGAQKWVQLDRFGYRRSVSWRDGEPHRRILPSSSRLPCTLPLQGSDSTLALPAKPRSVICIMPDFDPPYRLAYLAQNWHGSLKHGALDTTSAQMDNGDVGQKAPEQRAPPERTTSKKCTTSHLGQFPQRQYLGGLPLDSRRSTLVDVKRVFLHNSL
ncbi:hypothetical protein QBC34DRAFT_424357 [Podospora aff. communis PSN243]|uniref:Uncharacterized protein n=1 Tax=Podospora aff. communis PSN243 TaxID=3040156 RepID=A0AAV9GRQ3_9PEZI|nr:hypothetical protein QBC34DRAFT_424357 [Podospora aff. communis PSN243]